ncbi:MAG: RdgB/HAM1 family non-canonical purine NTP pyrophosphatase [Mariprofundaceae bacterium]
MRLIIASNNQKKRSEIASVLQALSIDIVPAEQTVFIEVEEDGNTFAENAAKKAIAFSRINRLPALADDSGLIVDTLDGAPGIYSGRYAGEHATDAQNVEKLLLDMAGNPERKARFECALHLEFPGEQAAITASGRVYGYILEQTEGNKGFGYDPVFYCPELGKSFASARPEEKVRVSHRGRALIQFLALLNRSLSLRAKKEFTLHGASTVTD